MSKYTSWHVLTCHGGDHTKWSNFMRFLPIVSGWWYSQLGWWHSLTNGEIESRFQNTHQLNDMWMEKWMINSGIWAFWCLFFDPFGSFLFWKDFWEDNSVIGTRHDANPIHVIPSEFSFPLMSHLWSPESHCWWLHRWERISSFWEIVERSDPYSPCHLIGEK